VGDPAREVNAGGEPLILQGGHDRILQRPVPADEHAKVLAVDEDGWEGLGEVLDAFLPAQPADVADEGRAVGQGGGDGEGSFYGRKEPRITLFYFIFSHYILPLVSLSISPPLSRK